MSSKFSYRERLWKLRIFNTILVNIVLFLSYMAFLELGLKIGLPVALIMVVLLILVIRTTLKLYLDEDESFTNNRPMEKWAVIIGVTLMVMTNTVSLVHLIRKTIAIHLMITIYIMRSSIVKENAKTKK